MTCRKIRGPLKKFWQIDLLSFNELVAYLNETESLFLAYLPALRSAEVGIVTLLHVY